MEDKKIKIVLTEEREIHLTPPLINLVRILLDLGYEVVLIAPDADKLPESVTTNSLYRYVLVFNQENRTSQFKKFVTRRKLSAEISKKTDEAMKDADILWTGTMQTARDMWKTIRKYRHVLQLMELTEYGFSTRLTRFPLEALARSAWRNVVPERNRAYIQRTWWDLDSVPYVLPNKPYSLDYGEITEEMKPAIEKIQGETKKIILYLGGFFADRDFDLLARAIKESKDYVLYIVGRAYREDLRRKLEDLISLYDIQYLGHFDAPKHLAFVKYAHIGVLPYKTVHVRGLSDLNALYCAPNKIFEYAGFGIPMIGSNVLGLIEPFEKYGIGVVWDEKHMESFYDAIKEVEDNYTEMSKKCKEYYNSIDLHSIVRNILAE